MRTTALSPSAGFTLVETLVAAAVAVTVLASLAEVAAMAAAASRANRRSAAAAIAASAKLEQLRALAWRYDADGRPVSDVTSDTSVDPPRPAGGRGLSPSPGGVLEHSTPGWVDYVNEAGEALGGGDHPPAGAVLARRWAVEPIDAGDTIVVEVCVVRLVAGPRGEPAPEICLATIRSRQP
ncbi:MAG: hypothetical protein AB7H88_02605 [Vicinamibacterales bacterium]